MAKGESDARKARDFYTRALGEAEKALLPEARELDGLDEEIALLRVKLIQAIREKPQDLNLTQASQAVTRAQAQTCRWGREAWGGEITVPVHCGQELYDVVDITDPRAGLEGALRRIAGLTLSFQPRRGLHQHRLLLGGV